MPEFLSPINGFIAIDIPNCKQNEQWDFSYAGIKHIYVVHRKRLSLHIHSGYWRFDSLYDSYCLECPI